MVGGKRQTEAYLIKLSAWQVEGRSPLGKLFFRCGIITVLDFLSFSNGNFEMIERKQEYVVCCDPKKLDFVSETLLLSR